MVGRGGRGGARPAIQVRVYAKPATALSQPPVTFTWKPSRSVKGQSGRALPSSRVLLNGRKPPGHTYSSVW